MSEFPRTVVGGISVPRLVCGTNWLLGWSHTSLAKDKFLKELYDTPTKMAKVLEVFARRGCNALMSKATEFTWTAVKEVEQRTGVEMIWITTPSYADPKDPSSWKQSVELAKKLGGKFCFPHQGITDALLDRENRRLMPRLVEHLALVRRMGMVPGLSTHTPETIVCADATDADVEAYLQPYNAEGFLCQVETDWLQKVFAGARKPVIVIKPLAAGRLMPPTGLTFVWNTIRPCDLVTVGVLSAYEAEEDIELSLACLEHRMANVELQYTRSKQVLVAEGPAAPRGK